MENKPADLIESLGMDVTLESKELENDTWAQSTLNDIGRTMKVDGMTYAGTVAIHYYIDSNAVVKSSYGIATKHQITFPEDISEQLVAMGMNNAVIAVREHFNPNYKYKTIRPNDKRSTK